MAADWLRGLSQKAAHIRMLQPVYHAALGPLNEELKFSHFPPDLFPADAGRGRWASMGQIDMNGHRLPIDDQWLIGTPWQESPFFTKLHGFCFLPELQKLGGDVGRRGVRDITARWLAYFGRYHPKTWTIRLTAWRLYHWMVIYPFAFETAPDDFMAMMEESFYKQHQHLLNDLNKHESLNRHDRFDLIWILLMVQCHCETLYDEIACNSYMQLLYGAVEDLSLPDEGVRTRDGNGLIDFSQKLIALRHSLQLADRDAPAWLLKRIETAVRTLNVLTHSDKDLSSFQGTWLPQKAIIEKMTRLSNSRFRRNDTRYPDYGYSSIRKGRTSVIIDHGKDSDYHVAPLSFEMAYANHRLIVNCGTYYGDERWHKSLSQMAAHNCLTVNDKDVKPQKIKSKTSLESMNGASLFSGTHHGYEADYALTHTRRIYLDSKGEDLRGEDILARNIAVKTIPFTVRFHLHPNVKASMTDNRQSVLLRLPSGAGWAFQSNHDTLSLEESMYCTGGLDRP